MEATGEEAAKAIRDALVPDNVAVPEGMSVKVSLKGRTVTVEVSSQDEWDTLISTVDEILEYVQLAGSVMSRSS